MSTHHRRRPAISAWVALSFFLGACGGAAGGAPSEATSSDTSAGGEAESAEEMGGYAPESEDGNTMAAEPLGPDQQGLLDEYDDETVQLTADLDGALELSAPNCSRAGELRDAICDLATRICDIAAEHPEHADVVNKCSDGRSQCENARQGVDERCP